MQQDALLKCLEAIRDLCEAAIREHQQGPSEWTEGRCGLSQDILAMIDATKT
jgi:hypothetical protein